MKFSEKIILTITAGATGVIATYLKKKIREPHKTTQYDVLCNLRGRIVELEVRQKVFNKKNPTLNPKTRSLFETMNDAKARAMNLSMLYLDSFVKVKSAILWQSKR